MYVDRSIDQIVGNLFSMSWASKNLLGSQAMNFENELRQKIRTRFGNKKFIERVKFIVHLLHK
jgi:hypothetical protein